jgi:hypothetical protein
VVVARLAIRVQLPDNEAVTVTERREQRSFWTVADFAVFWYGVDRDCASAVLDGGDNDGSGASSAGAPWKRRGLDGRKPSCW